LSSATCASTLHAPRRGSLPPRAQQLRRSESLETSGLTQRRNELACPRASTAALVLSTPGTLQRSHLRVSSSHPRLAQAQVLVQAQAQAREQGQERA
jgi:hypothetical protein